MVGIEQDEPTRPMLSISKFIRIPKMATDVDALAVCYHEVDAVAAAVVGVLTDLRMIATATRLAQLTYNGISMQ